ncbi:MAG: bifunctional riboflavin kinase/FMN adenylyltransferase, partial [Megasphaera sp.]
MEIFHSFQEITGFTGAVVALGTFDGIHKGHQMVMKTAIKRAAAGGVKT